MDLLDLFNDPSEADVLFILSAATSPSTKKKIYAHKLVLRQSAYISDKLVLMARKRKIDGDEDILVSVEEQFAEDWEAEAFERVLRLLYGRSEEQFEQMSRDELLRAFCVADRMRVHKTLIDAIVAAVAAAPVEEAASPFDELELPDEYIEAFFALPESARRTNNVFDDFVYEHVGKAIDRMGNDETIQRLMVQAFGDVPAVLASVKMKYQFASLPDKAILAWLKADDLIVHSENCVVCLLSFFFAHERNSRGDARRRKSFVDLVRLINVSPMYMNAVIPRLGWLHEPQQDYEDEYACMEDEGLQHLLAARAHPELVSTMAAAARPSGWYLEARERSGIRHCSISIDIPPTTSVPAGLEDELCVRSTRPTYVNGAVLACEVRKDASKVNWYFRLAAKKFTTNTSDNQFGPSVVACLKANIHVMYSANQPAIVRPIAMLVDIVDPGCVEDIVVTTDRPTRVRVTDIELS